MVSEMRIARLYEGYTTTYVGFDDGVTTSLELSVSKVSSGPGSYPVLTYAVTALLLAALAVMIVVLGIMVGLFGV